MKSLKKLVGILSIVALGACGYYPSETPRIAEAARKQAKECCLTAIEHAEPDNMKVMKDGEGGIALLIGAEKDKNIYICKVGISIERTYSPEGNSTEAYYGCSITGENSHESASIGAEYSHDNPIAPLYSGFEVEIYKVEKKDDRVWRTYEQMLCEGYDCKCMRMQNKWKNEHTERMNSMDETAKQTTKDIAELVNKAVQKAKAQEEKKNII